MSVGTSGLGAENRRRGRDLRIIKMMHHIVASKNWYLIIIIMAEF